MSKPSALLDLLLTELNDGFVIPERYSRRSAYRRFEPLIMTTTLALIAVAGSILACELTRDAHADGAAVRRGVGSGETRRSIHRHRP